MISQRLSHYSILEKLGSDEAGELYLAEDTRLGRRVVLRMLPASYGYDPSRRERFLKLAGEAAALRSPHIALVYDIGEQDGNIFIVTEYVEGERLSARLGRGPLVPREVIDLAIQAADALDEAHTRGQIHGDLRSSNFIVSGRGLLKTLNFGLARSLARQPSPDPDSTIRLGQETALDVVGSNISYMSPEQALGHEIDHRSDIFSLGVVIYEMLAGRLPFEGETPTATLQKIIHHEAPAIKRLDYSAPLEIWRILRKTLEKDRERRYQSARELLVDLRNLKRDDSGAVAGRSAGRPTSVLNSSGSSRRRTSRKRVSSLAVLPMVNASADPDAEYLSDGISESLINNLSQLPKLKVMARSTVFRYKNREIDPKEVGRELGVEALVTGRVLLRGDNLIISTELVDAADGSLIWGRNYNRRFSDIFAIQEGIAQELTDNLRLKLTGEEKKRLGKRFTTVPEAYQLYLKGRYYWNRRTEEGLRKGIEHFNLAIEADPAYALAYAGLSDCYAMLCWHSIAAHREVVPKARAAAACALELDGTLAEAHASMGAVCETEWDWSCTEQEYRRALELNPNYATAHQWYAEFLANTGRYEEALQEMKRAQELDPLSSVINTEVGWVLCAARRFDPAIEHLQNTIELDPEFALAHWQLAEAYKQKREFDRALGEIQTAIRLSGSSTRMIARLAHTYAVAGRKEEALKVLFELEEQSREKYVSPYEIAIIYTGLGEHDQAFTWLERAYEDRSSWLIFLNTELNFDEIRSDPRFLDLLTRVGLNVS